MRSAASVCANLGESFGKRRYPKHFVAKITDAVSENYETQVWLDKALSREHISARQYNELKEQSEEIARILHWMEYHPEHFTNKLDASKK